jgi:hypothetical protein
MYYDLGVSVAASDFRLSDSHDNTAGNVPAIRRGLMPCLVAIFLSTPAGDTVS